MVLSGDIRSLLRAQEQAGGGLWWIEGQLNQGPPASAQLRGIITFLPAAILWYPGHVASSISGQRR